MYSMRADAGTVLIEPPVSGITASVGAGATLNSSGQQSIGGELIWMVNVTATSTSSNHVEIELPTLSAFSAKDLTFEMYTPDFTNIHQIIVYAGTAGYALFASRVIGTALTTPSSQGPFAINGLTSYWIHEALWTKNGFTDPVGDIAFTKCKLRIYVPNTKTLSFGLRSVQAGVMKRKARLAITADDGYRSWLRMGVPILNEYGLTSTMSIIYIEIGVAVKASLAELKRFVAAGGECIAHGPNHPTTGGTGNLFTAWATNAERIADVVACRDYLVANGLTNTYGQKCYIWPQGKYAASVFDLSFPALMLDNGFTVARTAAGTNGSFYMQKNTSLSAKNLQRLAGPIVGHQWASAGTEAANISSIISYIQGIAAAGGDGTLMLHDVVGVDAAASPTQISSNRLRQVCVAIGDLVDAGTLEVVPYSHFAR